MKNHHILSLKGISFIAYMQYFGTLSQTSRVVLKKTKSKKKYFWLDIFDFFKSQKNNTSQILFFYLKYMLLEQCASKALTCLRSERFLTIQNLFQKERVFCIQDSDFFDVLITQLTFSQHCFNCFFFSMSSEEIMANLKNIWIFCFKRSNFFEKVKNCFFVRIKKLTFLTLNLLMIVLYSSTCS